MAANFKKKSVPLSSRGQAVPRGSKLSISNNQLLVSSGVPSLDNIIGGGIPVGSLLLIEEDTHAIFSNILLRYFLAEGVICKHGLSIVSANACTADEIFKKLPTPVDYDVMKPKSTASREPDEKKNNEEELKIAWRYQNLSSQEVTSNTVKFGHYYDLTTTMEDHHFSGLHITKFISTNYTETEPRQKNDKINPVCKALISDIQNLIKNHNYSSAGSQPDKRILRLALNSFGSPLWSTFTSTDEMMSSISWFLLALRSVLRNAFAVCLLSIPVHLYEDPSISKRLEQCVDNAVHLESFGGSIKEHNPAFADYDGLIHIKKKGRINCLAGHDIDTSDWAFKLKRKKFSIEKLHLPPELSETASRAQLDTKKVMIQSGTPLCSSNPRTANKSLEF